ncbi:MAG TPA: gamma-glutamylcyclotransferase [Stellaceae bacterium]|nr:gamma-glutamylcyclotransferase [Stellaceae bacterium]
MSTPKGNIQLTRESIMDGSMRRWLATADPSVTLATDEEHAASIAALLKARPDAPGDVWVFAYGSLIWNPTIHTLERRCADLRGYHRRFCLWTHLGRGTPDCPGLMLALERGGSCRGVAYRIAEAQAEHELMILWRREMVTGAYRPRWVKTVTLEGPVAALAFTMNPQHQRYAGRLPEAQVAAVIARAEGALGPCSKYLFSTVEHLRELGIRDHGMERLARQVEALRRPPSDLDAPPCPET